jgi:hypothetical protein
LVNRSVSDLFQPAYPARGDDIENMDVGHENMDVGHEDMDVGHEDMDVGHEDVDVGHEDMGVDLDANLPSGSQELPVENTKVKEICIVYNTKQRTLQTISLLF